MPHGNNTPNVHYVARNETYTYDLKSNQYECQETLRKATCKEMSKSTVTDGKLLVQHIMNDR